ncbi:hypothetical protein EE612_009002 [Oryza sativa]|nr:hypothetical protein EE612_009002 [Oryza sativa]
MECLWQQEQGLYHRYTITCICTRNSVLTLREASLSLPSPRWPHRESISSMKIMEGAFSRAIWNRFVTSFSLSPIHLERRSDEDILQMWNRPLSRRLWPSKICPSPVARTGGRLSMASACLQNSNCGNWTGSTTASCSACFAPSSPETSLHLTLGFSETIAEWSPARSLARSDSSSPPHFALPSSAAAAGGVASSPAAGRSASRISSARAM